MAPYDGWVWPLELHARDNRKPVISDGYGTAQSGKRGGKGHYGADVMYRRLVSGTPDLPGRTKGFECVDARVLCAFEGDVWAVNRTDPHGISVQIDHHHVPGVGPRVTVYRHLATCALVKGQSVQAGDVIGVAGYDTTRPASETPNHLHFELWDTSRPKTTGNPRVDFGLDPAPLMGSWSFRGRRGELVRGTGALVAAAGSEDAHGDGEPGTLAMGALAAGAWKVGLL